MEAPSRTHLGDGIYASYDGYVVELSTERVGRADVTYLEPDTLQALMLYLERVFPASIPIPPLNRAAPQLLEALLSIEWTTAYIHDEGEFPQKDYCRADRRLVEKAITKAITP